MYLECLVPLRDQSDSEWNRKIVENANGISAALFLRNTINYGTNWKRINKQYTKISNNTFECKMFGIISIPEEMQRLLARELKLSLC